MTIASRNNVKVIGSGHKTIVMAHGFGCDQNMWRFLTPSFTSDYRIVLFDYVGSGRSDANSFKVERYSNLDGYAQDVIEVCEALDLRDVLFIGHSVSAMIGLIAAIRAPALFGQLVMVCPSPSFLNDPPDYMGGFEHEDLEELLALMDRNYIGWAHYLASAVIGTGNDEALIAELSGNFCSTDPLLAKTFARATFFADCRSLLPETSHPTLILQSETDSLAPLSVGSYMQARMPGSRLEVVRASGHCLHMTHAAEIAEIIRGFSDQHSGL
ncbi:alpha/beta fold hydrolase [Bosea sp. R86505]|uniref:alpha/beta fold hydrolase n=1 Tax=Bosea sp. R86505 TaxID=3101710 RepID=UPI00366EC7D0